MQIAVLSGKGGTGKTLLSVNLASLAKDASYIDCDVEEPNGHLFFKPEIHKEKEIMVKVPELDDQLCDGSRKCVEFCRFNAMAYINDKLIIFDQMCHSCGGCILVCPNKALSEKDRPIGKILEGRSQGVRTLTGILNTGEASGIPIIDQLLDQAGSGNVIVDSPPGTACSAMESIKDADYCILVAEPTIFGLHNLKMVDELVRLFEKPYGVVINKAFPQDSLIDDYCRQENIEVLAKIQYDPYLGKLNSDGLIASRLDSSYRRIFQEILEKIGMEVDHERIINS